jgi:phosphatidylglycerol:prolipoprotein diacylglycerol transferase
VVSLTAVDVAFYLPGDLPIYVFPLILGLGATLGLGWSAWRAPVGQAHRQVDAGLWALFGGLLGGRAAYAAFNWSYYRTHLEQVPAVYLGGLAWPGALAGSLLALALFAAAAHTSFGSLADGLLPLLVTLTVSAWLGCWLEGCAYGALADTWWGMPARDEWGAFASRWPVQFLGALLVLGAFLAIDLNRARLRVPGQAAVLGAFSLSLEMFALSFLRADPALSWLGLRLDAWSGLACALLCALGFVFLRKPEAPAGSETAA